MYSLSIIFSLLSVYCLYATAKKVEIDKKHLMQYLDLHPRISKTLAVFFFLFSTILLTVSLGVASGILGSVVLWSTGMSCMILFAPFQTVKQYHIILFSVISLGLEFTLTSF